MSNHRKDDVERVARMMAALSNPRRLELFLRIADCTALALAAGSDGEPCGCDCGSLLAAELGIAPSTISHHLKELRSAGLVGVERDGRRLKCWAEADALRELSEFIGSCAGGDD